MLIFVATYVIRVFNQVNLRLLILHVLVLVVFKM